MLSELWNFVKLSFNKRLALYEIIVLSLTVFGRFPYPIVKYCAFIVFVAASVVFVPIAASQSVSYLRLILAHKNRAKYPASREIAALAKQMNVQVKELGFVKGCTAYVWGRSLVLGIGLLRRLTLDERQAVVAHELGHIKQRFVIWRLVLMVPLLAIPLYSWWELTSPIFFTEQVTHIMITIMVAMALLAYIRVVMVPVNWLLEAGADKIAAKFVGKENIKSALLALASKEEYDTSSETHPSISERIKRIDKVEL